MPSPFRKHLHWLLLGWLTAGVASAAVYPLPPPGSDVIGQVRVAYANPEDTLLDIARRHSLGYEEIVHANPGVDRWMPGQETPIVLPTRYILPDAPREGIVLNIPEMRLYYYPKAGSDGQRVVYTYPVSIGRMDWKTPLGVTRVTSKEIDPPWRPPASIKAEHAAQGDILPDVVPGGPDNPLGRHALRLALPSYLIHGTNRPFGIGMRVTHGCVRMYPEDIERLFGMVPVGVTVRIIDQPVKVGWLNGELFVEAHAPLEEDNLPIQITLEQAQRAVAAKTGPELTGVDQITLKVVVDQFSGMPVAISAEPDSIWDDRTAREPPDRFYPAYPTSNRLPLPNPAAVGPYPPYPPRRDPSPAMAAPAERPIPAGPYPPYPPRRAPSPAMAAPAERPIPGTLPNSAPPYQRPTVGYPPTYSTYPRHPTYLADSNPEPPPVAPPPVYRPAPYPTARYPEFPAESRPWPSRDSPPLPVELPPASRW
ncbi:MAG: L,D-transpeptidase family protein [Candidatus Competibacteraceae bacterium]|nr:L,D-transpeptidase family protein [Candidatus Competibacteraceae bacterium]